MSNLNTKRGEFEIEINGVRYVMRPTFEAMLRFEELAKANTMDIMAMIERKSMPARAMVAAVFSGIHAAEEKNPPDLPTFEKLGQTMMEDGFQNFIEPVTRYLTGAVLGKDTAQAMAEMGLDGSEDPKKGSGTETTENPDQ